MNYKYKCIAIDDEPLALSLIETYIKKTPELEFAGAYSNAMQAMEKISTGDVDIVFSNFVCRNPLDWKLGVGVASCCELCS